MDVLMIPKFICDFLSNFRLDILELRQVRWQINFVKILRLKIDLIADLTLKFVTLTSRTILSSWTFLWSWWSLAWCYSTIAASCMMRWTSCKSAETVNADKVFCIPGTCLCIQGTSFQGKDKRSCSKNDEINHSHYIWFTRWNLRNCAIWVRGQSPTQFPSNKFGKVVLNFC